MKRLIGKLILGFLIISGILVSIIGCSSQNTPTATPGAISPTTSSSPGSPQASASPGSPAATTDIQTVAEPIMKNILVSLNNDDYAGFSKDFSPAVKNALNQTVFNQLYTQFKTAIGDYQSVLYVSDTVQNDINLIIYVAQFSKEPAGVTVTLGLQSANGGYQVQGLNFNSPNLAGHPLDVQQIRAYADSEAENVLVSLNNNDYAGFSKDFDPVAKNASPESSFTSLYNLIKSTVGDYQSSIEFESASEQNSIVTIRYLAKYSNEPSGVWVTISFDSNHKIAGLYFNSPSLAAAQSK